MLKPNHLESEGISTPAGVRGQGSSAIGQEIFLQEPGIIHPVRALHSLLAALGLNGQNKKPKCELFYR